MSDTQYTVPPDEDELAEEREEQVAGPGDRSRLGRFFGQGSTSWIFLALLVMIGTFSALRFEAFATVRNFTNIAIDASGLLIIAVGATFVIITAGIDLSVGSVLVFSAVVAAKTMIALGGQGWGVVAVGLIAGILAGLAWGLLNGVLITKARIPPLIVTLGTLGMALGFALLLTGGINIRDVPQEMVSSLGTGDLLGVLPWIVVIAVVVTAIAVVTLRSTRFGRHTYAIGSNAEAARRAGINVDRHLIKIYGLQGLLAGLAGMISLARFSNTTVGGHTFANLEAISAVVIGGTSLFGGVGTIFGTVIGVFIPAVLQNGFIILRVQPFWQEVAVGAVLIVAVYIDQLRRRGQQQG